MVRLFHLVLFSLAIGFFIVARPSAVFASTPRGIDNDVLSSSSQILVDVDYATGALVYRYPIALPVGRDSMTPSLDLIYHSQNKNSASEVSFGWSLHPNH